MLIEQCSGILILIRFLPSQMRSSSRGCLTSILSKTSSRSYESEKMPLPTKKLRKSMGVFQIISGASLMEKQYSMNEQLFVIAHLLQIYLNLWENLSRNMDSLSSALRSAMRSCKQLDSWMIMKLVASIGNNYFPVLFKKNSSNLPLLSEFNEDSIKLIITTDLQRGNSKRMVLEVNKMLH